MPAGGLVMSILSSIAVPKVSAERRCERLHARQKAMSFATLTSLLGMMPWHLGQVGVTDSLDTSFSSNCMMTFRSRWYAKKLGGDNWWHGNGSYWAYNVWKRTKF